MPALEPSFFPDDPGFVLLDIGPGLGELVQRYGERHRVVAVEPDAEYARRVASAWPDRVLMCRGVGEALPLREAGFDGVTLLEVLEHVDDPDVVLHEAARVLKPRGALCVAVPTSYTEAVYSRLHPQYMTNATHVRVFKKQELIARIERQGFAVQEVRTANLEAAVSWFFHALKRSRSDASGYIYEHHGIDARLARVMERVSTTAGIWRVVPWARERFGKSWYVYARKAEETSS